MFRKIYPHSFILLSRSKSRLDQGLDQMIITHYLPQFFLNLSISLLPYLQLYFVCNNLIIILFILEIWEEKEVLKGF